MSDRIGCYLLNEAEASGSHTRKKERSRTRRTFLCRYISRNQVDLLITHHIVTLPAELKKLIGAVHTRDWQRHNRYRRNSTSTTILNRVCWQHFFSTYDCLLLLSLLSTMLPIWFLKTVMIENEQKCIVSRSTCRSAMQCSMVLIITQHHAASLSWACRLSSAKICSTCLLCLLSKTWRCGPHSLKMYKLSKRWKRVTSNVIEASTRKQLPYNNSWLQGICLHAQEIGNLMGEDCGACPTGLFCKMVNTWNPGCSQKSGTVPRSCRKDVTPSSVSMIYNTQSRSDIEVAVKTKLRSMQLEHNQRHWQRQRQFEEIWYFSYYHLSTKIGSPAFRLIYIHMFCHAYPGFHTQLWKSSKGINENMPRPHNTTE